MVLFIIIVVRRGRLLVRIGVFLLSRRVARLLLLRDRRVGEHCQVLGADLWMLEVLGPLDLRRRASGPL